jgi:hypothetical protein
MKHLWEHDHPYYCSEQHYFGTGTSRENPNSEFKSWAEFLEAMGDADKDYNLIFRWDWERSKDGEPLAAPTDPYYRDGQLKLFYMIQRKGYHRMCEVEVCPADEPLVREFLAPHWEHMRRLWEPLGGELEPVVEDE